MQLRVRHSNVGCYMDAPHHMQKYKAQGLGLDGLSPLILTLSFRRF